MVKKIKHNRALKYKKQLFAALLAAILLSVAACGLDNYDVNVTAALPEAASGLDLEALGSLVAESSGAEEIEKKLNDPAVGLNNLDLDGDGNVDFIAVNEYGDSEIGGFSFTTGINGELQEIATVTVEKSQDGGAVEVAGNEQIYGYNHYYRSHFGLSDLLIASYLFNSHRHYSSPWGYNSYPDYYRGYSTRPAAAHMQNSADYKNSSASSFTQSSNSQNSRNVTSPNRGKSASSIRAPLRNPTATQRSFQANSRTNSRSGGFGTVRRSSSTRSGSFFGGGK